MVPHSPDIGVTIRILYLNYEFPPYGGGAATVSYEVARQYELHGHEVDVITMGTSSRCVTSHDGSMHVHRIPSRRSSGHPSLAEMLIFLTRAFLYARALTTAYRYDVCHAHFILPTGLVAYLLCRMTKVPYVLTSHGSDVIGFDPRFRHAYHLVRPIWHAVIAGASCVTAPSAYLCKKIERERDGTSCTVVYNGIDPSFLSPMEKERYIVVTARAVREKGMHDIIRAIAGMRLDGWHIKIIGDGRHFDELRELCNEAGVGHGVEFYGWLNNRSEHYHRLIGRAAIFVSTSRLESFSVSVLEAMQAGCMLVLTDIEPFLELFSHATFFSAGDPSSLRAALERAMHAFDAGGRQHHDTSCFHWSHIGEAYISLLEMAAR